LIFLKKGQFKIQEWPKKKASKGNQNPLGAFILDLSEKSISKSPEAANRAANLKSLI
jgi:hypothetical protein